MKNKINSNYCSNKYRKGNQENLMSDKGVNLKKSVVLLINFIDFQIIKFETTQKRQFFCNEW